MRPCLAVLRVLVLIALASLPIISVARADWPAGGKIISVPGDIWGVHHAAFFDLPDGELGVLGIGRSPSNFYYNLQRLGHDGVIHPGWPEAGVQFGGAIAGIPVSQHGLGVDPAGFIWHSIGYGGTTGVIAFYVGPGLEGLGTSFVAAPRSLNQVVSLANAPNGDAFIVSDHRLRRVTRGGTTAAGWASTGFVLPLTSSTDDSDVIPDGSGGVIVFQRGDFGGFPVVSRIDSAGVRHTGWPAGGKPLTNIPPAPLPVFVPCNSRLLPAGPGHFIAAWQYPTAATGEFELHLQRFDVDGAIDPDWGVSGLAPFDTSSFTPMSLIPDGTGGLYVVYTRAGVPVATHVTAAGGILGAIDTPVLPPGAQYVPTYTFYAPPEAQLADRTPNGGLLVGWNDTRLSPGDSFRLRWLNADLTPDTSKPDTGLVYFPNSPHPYPGKLLAIHAEGDDAALVAWSDYHDNGFGQIIGDLWMNRVQVPTPVTGIPPHATPATLALSAPRPNPARGSVALDVTLSDGAPARVELLDVTGRIVRRQTVQGAGVHAINFSELGSLEPGLYFARVSNHAAARSTRLVVTH